MACYDIVNKDENTPEFNRRNFLKNTSLATLMAMVGGVELHGEDAPKATPAAGTILTEIPIGPTVKYGVIGLGGWGREVLKSLALLPNAPVVAICDNYHSSLRRAGEADAPKAEKFEDYKALLASKEVEAVVIATPTPAHPSNPPASSCLENCLAIAEGLLPPP